MSRQQFQEGYRGAGTSGPRRFEPIRPSSPDPVHLVLQYEEDERLARHLQEHGTLSPLDPVGEDRDTDDIEECPRRLQDEIIVDYALAMLSLSSPRDIRGQMRNMERLIGDAENRVEEEDNIVENDESSSSSTEEDNASFPDSSEESDESFSDSSEEGDESFSDSSKEGDESFSDSSKEGDESFPDSSEEGDESFSDSPEEGDESSSSSSEEGDEYYNDSSEEEHNDVLILEDAFGDVTLDMLSQSCLLDISEQVRTLERPTGYAEVEEDDETDEDESTTSASEEDGDNSEEDHPEVMEIERNHDGLDSFEIERLPTRVCSDRSLSKVKKDSLVDKACQVCLENYANGDKLRILPCFHEFHALCIDQWLMTTSTCPICRVKVDVSGQSTT